MIGKITKGTAFTGCVEYVLDEDRSILLKSEGVEGTKAEIAEQFYIQTLLNDKVKNIVGHISLSFSPEDSDKMNNGYMVKIALEYMKMMNIANTQYIIVRHTDKKHPHCHIVYNRVNNDGRTISDKNDRYRNELICKKLTEKYGLHFSQRQKKVENPNKAYILRALGEELKMAKGWGSLESALGKRGISIQFKLNRVTKEREGVKFGYQGVSYNGSSIDRSYSYKNICNAFSREENAVRKNEIVGDIMEIGAEMLGNMKMPISEGEMPKSAKSIYDDKKKKKRKKMLRL